MKNIFLILIAFFGLAQGALADVSPRYHSSISHYGIGVAKVKSKIKIYDSAEDNKSLITEISYDKKGNLVCSSGDFNCRENLLFIAFEPKKDIAFVSVEDENEDMLQICYNQKKQLYGWIEKSSGAKFLTYNELLNSYGKKYGFYMYADSSQSQKRLYGAADVKSGSTGAFKLAKHIYLWLIQGNWALVKVIDFDNKEKVGWLRYRSDDGRLYGFVNLD